MKISTVIWFVLGGGALFLVYEKFFAKKAGTVIPPYQPPGQVNNASRTAAVKPPSESTLDQILKGIKAASGAVGILGGGGSSSGSSSGIGGKLSDLFKTNDGGDKGKTLAPLKNGLTDTPDTPVDFGFEGDGISFSYYNSDLADPESLDPLPDSLFQRYTPGDYNFSSTENAPTAPVYQSVSDYNFSPNTSQTFNFSPSPAIDYSAQIDAQALAIDRESNAELSASFSDAFAGYGGGLDGGYSFDYNPSFDSYA